MGFRFRKSFRLAKGVRINVGSRGLTSVSVGGKWGGVSFGKRGTGLRVSAPGTGLSYTTRLTSSASVRTTHPEPATEEGFRATVIAAEILVAGVVALCAQNILVGAVVFLSLAAAYALVARERRPRPPTEPGSPTGLGRVLDKIGLGAEKCGWCQNRLPRDAASCPGCGLSRLEARDYGR